jgi:hypothetical protein
VQAVAQKQRLALVTPAQNNVPLYLNPMGFMGADDQRLDVQKWEAARQQQAAEAAEMEASMGISTKVEQGGWLGTCWHLLAPAGTWAAPSSPRPLVRLPCSRLPALPPAPSHPLARTLTHPPLHP